MVVSKGDIAVEGVNITIKGSSGAADKTVDLTNETTLQVNTPSGKNSVTVPAEEGFYILNLRQDTLVGSQQNLGNDLGGRTITQEELKTKIDSLVQLTTGANISPQNRNFIVLPNQVVKVSANKKAKVFGPFTKIPGSLDADENGKAPEVFKFYTTTEMRELIANLKKQTI
jgi:hypothetical protein